jgi:hypothetical protein
VSPPSPAGRAMTHRAIGCGGVKQNLAPIDDLVTRAVLFRLDSGALANLVAHAQESGSLRKHLASTRPSRTDSGKSWTSTRRAAEERALVQVCVMRIGDDVSHSISG